MNTRVTKRIEVLEKRLGINAIPANERFIVIPFPDCIHAEFDRQYRQRLSVLKTKYGQNISDNDLLIIGIRKFYRKESEEKRS